MNCSMYTDDQPIAVRGPDGTSCDFCFVFLMTIKFDFNWEGKMDNMVHPTKRIRPAEFEPAT